MQGFSHNLDDVYIRLVCRVALMHGLKLCITITVQCLMPGIGQVWPINGFPEPSTAFNENSMIKNLYQKDGKKRDKYNNRVKEIRCCVDVTSFEIWNFQLYKQLYNLQWLSLIFYGIFEKRINKIAILIVRWSSHYITVSIAALCIDFVWALEALEFVRLSENNTEEIIRFIVHIKSKNYQ